MARAIETAVRKASKLAFPHYSQLDPDPQKESLRGYEIAIKLLVTARLTYGEAGPEMCFDRPIAAVGGMDPSEELVTIQLAAKQIANSLREKGVEIKYLNHH